MLYSQNYSKRYSCSSVIVLNILEDPMPANANSCFPVRVLNIFEDPMLGNASLMRTVEKEIVLDECSLKGEL